MSKIRSFLGRFLPAPARTTHKMYHDALIATTLIDECLSRIELVNEKAEIYLANITGIAQKVDELEKCVLSVAEQLSALHKSNNEISSCVNCSKGQLTLLEKKLDEIDDRICSDNKRISEAAKSNNELQCRVLSSAEEIMKETKLSSLQGTKLSRVNTDLRKASFLLAGIETAKYIEANMPKVKIFRDQYEMLKECVLQAGEGLYLEFGVYSGKTINIIADARPDRQIHGFDSFEGLPETWRSRFEKGTFRKEVIPEVRENVVLHIGMFEDSLKEFTRVYKGKCAFVHIDCDLYSSTKTIFKYLKDQISSNTILLFDEFFNYPSWKDNEFKAFHEFIAEQLLSYEYIGYVEDYEQAVVRII